jgi:hypothetical protein
MSSVKSRLVFYGQIAPGQDIVEVKGRLAEMFRTDIVKIEQLFSGKPITVKRDLSQDEAQQFKTIFDRTGAISVIESIEGEHVTSSSTRVAPTSSVRPTKPPSNRSPSEKASPDVRSKATPLFKAIFFAVISFLPLAACIGFDTFSGSEASRVLAAESYTFQNGGVYVGSRNNVANTKDSTVFLSPDMNPIKVSIKEQRVGAFYESPVSTYRLTISDETGNTILDKNRHISSKGGMKHRKSLLYILDRTIGTVNTSKAGTYHILYNVDGPQASTGRTYVVFRRNIVDVPWLYYILSVGFMVAVVAGMTITGKITLTRSEPFQPRFRGHHT